eukprot:jgi/Bigna1/71619/fgenesh1_pg.16_\
MAFVFPRPLFFAFLLLLVAPCTEGTGRQLRRTASRLQSSPLSKLMSKSMCYVARNHGSEQRSSLLSPSVLRGTTTSSSSSSNRSPPAVYASSSSDSLLGGTVGAQEVSRKGDVAVVTGATRGIGKGIAIGLAEIGMKVYITGRTLKETTGDPAMENGGGDVGGSLEATKEIIESIGGSCVVVQVDHSDDDQVRSFFEMIEREEGRIDVLVNNAYSAVDTIDELCRLSESLGTPFWEKPIGMWDQVNNVGLRSHYVATSLAAPLLIKSGGVADGRPAPLVVLISSFGGLTYIFDVAYGVGKAAVDRMAADMARELAPKGVSVVSVWPGLVKTEKMSRAIGKLTSASALEQAESPVFVGRGVAALASAGNLMDRTGTIQSVDDLAAEFKFTDEEGKIPFSLRSMKALAAAGGGGKSSFVTRLLPAVVVSWVDDCNDGDGQTDAEILQAIRGDKYLRRIGKGIVCATWWRPL